MLKPYHHQVKGYPDPQISNDSSRSLSYSDRVNTIIFRRPLLNIRAASAAARKEASRMNETPSQRKFLSRGLAWTAVILLFLTAVFSAVALLFLLNITPAPYDVLKRVLRMLGGSGMPALLFFLWPLLTLIAGLLLLRRRPEHRRLGRWAVASGGTIFLFFAILLGGHALRHLGAAAAPKNPSTPRAFEAQTGPPVFPGAEGFGTRTPAGRGGKVIAVTSLADHGPGTLREALEQPFPRTVVFRVGGTIALEHPLHIPHPFVTVAGQTAPGDGILIRNCALVIASHDVLIQHLRIRTGNEGKVNPDENDAIEILGHGGRADGAHHVVLDHVSASWSEDETVSLWEGAHDVTLSWCVISEALDQSRHHKGHHSAGLLIGDASWNVTVHHCLLAHNGFRNPLITGGGTHDIVNNVIYDWGNLPAEIVDTDSNTFVNFIGNRFIPGPSSARGPYEILFNHGRGAGVPKIFVAGNLGPHRMAAEADDWALVGYGFGSAGVAPAQYRARTAFATAPVTTQTAAAALELVLAGAGATLPRRDAVDARVVADVRNGTGKLINSPREAGGYPEMKNGTPPPDTDGDGMPDAWEKAHGLNPNDPGDGNARREAVGSTNIERYLNSLEKYLR